MIDATKRILMMNPNATLQVDPETYAGIEQSAPELLNRVTVNQSRGRR